MTASLAALVGDDVVAALASLGTEPIDAVSITALPEGRSDRATFRVHLADGRVVKARRFRRVAKVERFTRMLRALSHPRLPPPLAVAGRVSIEAWVDGASVAALPPSRVRLLEAADLLASIHLPAGAPAARWRATHAVAASARRRLADLGVRGALGRAEVRALVHALQRCAPPIAEVGVTHNDFCAENLVEDAAGRLVPIDNEGLRRGFLDYDVARAWYRWPMSDDDWRAFADRYGAARALATGHAPFWRIAAVAKSAHLRLARGAGDAAIPIDRLRALLDIR